MQYDIYSGAGNDFVMIDNLKGEIPFDKQADYTKKICSEYYKDIDGVIFADKPETDNADIRMNYYNRDGSYGAMCGNGARCIAQFVHDKDIISDNNFIIEAVSKKYKAELKGNNIVKIYFPPPGKIILNRELISGDKIYNTHYINVGSDHLVIFLETDEELEYCRVNELGRFFREHESFSPHGVNVNFTIVKDINNILIRTYERGVERETLACGTGIISSAVISTLLNKTKPPVFVTTRSKEKLTVDFDFKDETIENLSLEGSARKVKNN